MIGRRPLVSGLAAVVLVAGLGPGAERPDVELAARRLVEERAAAAEAALERLEAALLPAVEAGRAASARVVAGDQAPGPRVREAARLVRAAERAASEARRAVAALDQVRRAAAPDAEPLEAATQRGELGSIASQLEASVMAADDFAEMRRRAEAVAPTIEAALAALDRGELDAAAAEVAEARALHGDVAAWQVELDTLPVWLETTDAIIGAVERIVNGTRTGDTAAARRAAEDFAALADDGTTADRAVRIAIGEGGSAVMAAPLGRLASVLASVADLRRLVLEMDAARR